MNTQQKNYAKARAIVETLEAESVKIEQAYIQEHGIVNPDGSIPKRIWCIEGEAIFDRANTETAQEVENLGLDKARRIFRETEDDLIRFGLSLIPAKQREVLRERCFGLNGHYAHVDVREKCVDLAFRLDVSTLPKSILKAATAV